VKVFGADLKEIEKIAVQIEKRRLSDFPDTRSVFAERTTGGYFLDFDVNREAAAALTVCASATSTTSLRAPSAAKTIATTVEGRETLIRSTSATPAIFREDLDALKRVLVPTPTGAQVPHLPCLQTSAIRPARPSNPRRKTRSSSGFVFVDITTDDIAGYVKAALRGASAKRVQFPPGYYHPVGRAVRVSQSPRKPGSKSSSRSRCFIIFSCSST